MTSRRPATLQGPAPQVRLTGDAIPDFSALLKDHFTAQSFPNDGKVTLTLVDVLAGEVGRDKQTRPKLYFTEDPRYLVCNPTNYGRLTAAHGSANSDDWIGATVEITKDPFVKDLTGKVTGSLIVTVTKPAAKKAPKMSQTK